MLWEKKRSCYTILFSQDGTLLAGVIQTIHMKTTQIILILLFLGIAAVAFTKPSDEICRKAAVEYVNGSSVKVPGYSNPSEDMRNGSSAAPENVMIKNRFFWKELKYIYSSDVRTIGYAYLGKVHLSGQSKNK